MTKQPRDSQQACRFVWKCDGFSLLEMIVVLSLVVLLLGIWVLRTHGLQNQGKIETARNDLRVFQTAVNSYYLNHQSAFPPDDNLQQYLIADSPRILRHVLYDPFRQPQAGYSYDLSSSGKYYVIFSYGPDESADINGISDNGTLTGQQDDDIFITNGTGTFG